MGLHARPDYQGRFVDTHGKVPDDEPLFVLRGQDAAAPAAVRAWANVAEELGASADIVALAREHACTMEAYQSEHGGKVPDL